MLPAVWSLQLLLTLMSEPAQAQVEHKIGWQDTLKSTFGHVPWTVPAPPKCSLDLQVVYSSADAPSSACSIPCPKEEQSTAFGGDEVVRVNYADGSLTTCQVLPKFIERTTPAPSRKAAPLRMKCLEGFTLIGGACYLVTPNPKSELEGSNDCVNYGANIATIESSHEQNTLRDVISTSVWVKPAPQRDESHTTGLGIDARTGKRNAPRAGEDCATLHPVSQWGYNTNDVNCQFTKRTLCKAAPVPVYEEPVCDVGQYKFRDSCFFFSAPETLDTAKADCRSKGGYLAFINSKEENDFVAGLFSETVYIGLHDHSSENVFVSEDFGVPLYTNWAHGQPDKYSYREGRCSEIRQLFGYEWNSIGCHVMQRALCESGPLSKCPTGQYAFQDSRYFFSEVGDYFTGATECRRRGGYPAYINSKEEHDYLKSIVVANVFLGNIVYMGELDYVSDFGSAGYTDPNPFYVDDAAHCITMDRTYSYQWSETDCLHPRSTLCETTVPVRCQQHTDTRS